MTGYARERTREHDRQTYGYGHNNFNILPPRAAYCLRTGAASMPHGCLFASASETFFLRRMSSRSGDERSGRKGTKMGLGPLDEPAFAGAAARLGSRARGSSFR